MRYANWPGGFGIIATLLQVSAATSAVVASTLRSGAPCLALGALLTMTPLAAGPTASELLAAARQNRETLSPNFAGFRSGLVVHKDGTLHEGRMHFRPPITLEVEFDDVEVRKAAKRTIRSMLSHRMPTRAEGSAAQERVTFGGEDLHALGRKVFLGDDLDSSYRIRDHRILEVDRRMQDERLVITVMETEETASGKYLPTHFFVVNYDRSTGAVLHSAAYRDAYGAVGGEYLPLSRQVASTVEGRTEVLRIEWRDLELLAPLPTAGSESSTAEGATALAEDSVEVTGQVSDSTGGVLPSATIFVRSLDTGLQTAYSADSTGRFELTLRDGRYRITAAMAGFAVSTAELDAADGPVRELAFRLVPAVLTQSVVVTGARDDELADDSIALIDTVSRGQMLDSGYERVSDILAEEPGIVTRSGSSGSRSETQIQGIDSRQALILLDGYPVVGARGIKRGILNMDRQSTNRLDRIEVVRGASSALYGSDAIGGVINMITRQPKRRFDANATASGGSLGAVDLRGDAGFMARRWSGVLNAESHRRDAYDLTPNTFDTTAPEFRRNDYMAKLSGDFSERLKVSLLANGFENRDDSRLLGERGPSATATDDSALNYGATLNASLAAGTQLQSRVYYGKYDESSVIDYLSNVAPIDETANLNERLYRLESSISQAVGGRQLLQGGFEWTRSEYKGFNRLLGDNAGQWIRMTDLWIHDRIQAHPRLGIEIGGRLNSHSRYGTALVPRFGILFRAAPSVTLRGSWGQGFRAPDLGQLYYRFQNPSNVYQVIGNPGLSPERSTTLQAGAEFRKDRLTVRGTYFRNDIRDLIQADLIGRPSTPRQLSEMLGAFGIPREFNPGLHRLFFLYRNLSNVFTTGAEGRLSLNLGRDLAASAGYTYLDARDKQTGQFLSQRHRHHGTFRLFWSPARMGGLRTNIRTTYLGRWPVAGRAGTLIGNAYQIWDWYAAKPVTRGVEVYGAVDNLLDSRDSGLASAQPTFLRADFGRTFRIGVRWSLGID